MKQEDLQPTIDLAKRESRPLLISIRFAEGFSIPSCSYGYFLGFDYSTVVNIQAEDRIHRVNSPGPVTIYYMKAQDTIDSDIIDILNDKSHEIANALDGVSSSASQNHSQLNNLIQLVKNRISE